jgi:hypothetical protein
VKKEYIVMGNPRDTLYEKNISEGKSSYILPCERSIGPLCLVREIKICESLIPVPTGTTCTS